jgi:hypothetical protein
MLETFHAQDPEQRAIRQLSNEKVDQSPSKNSDGIHCCCAVVKERRIVTVGLLLHRGYIAPYGYAFLLHLLTPEIHLRPVSTYAPCASVHLLYSMCKLVL